MKVRSPESGVQSHTVSAVALLVLVCFPHHSAAQEEAPALRPPLGELPPTFWEQQGTTIILSVVIALLLLALGIWLRLRPKPVAAVPPEVQARTALESLRNLPEDGAVISRVSQVLRRYVLAAFELPPGEPTTAEFCRQIAGNEIIDPGLSEALGTFLRQCDERKFTQSNPSTPLGAAARALELTELSETRRAELRQQAATQTAKPSVVSA